MCVCVCSREKEEVEERERQLHTYVSQKYVAKESYNALQTKVTSPITPTPHVLLHPARVCVCVISPSLPPSLHQADEAESRLRHQTSRVEELKQQATSLQQEVT